MMQFYLVHERHGKKIAYQDKEAELDKKAGWKEVTKEVFFGAQKAPEPVKATEKAGQDAELVAQYEALHGKKPHHRMSNDSIREALNDTAA